MKKMREPSQKLHNALYFMSGVMTVVLVLVILVGVKTKAQNAGASYEEDYSMSETSTVIPQQEETQTETAGDGDIEKWQEGVITYKGEQYRYNKNIRTYLMMGIDKDGIVEPAEDYISGGQSDALFLMVVDSKAQKMKVISINRNTMTTIRLCDEQGYDLGEIEGQLCLQHSFGDGKRLSCTRSVDAVSKLFGNIPISGYLSMNMGAIPTMNDAIGGVEVTVLDDLFVPDENVNLKKGETVTLNGTEAYYYLHGRDVTEFGSATRRLRREEQYIVAYMDKLKKIAGGDSERVVSIYDSIADYLVTSVDFTSLITELAGYEFSENQMYTVPGEIVEGEPIDGKTYEEYHVDEEAMQALIMEVFYEPVEQ